MNKREKLSAVIITYNEIERISGCIESIDFADEIVVVDSFSNDGTWEYLNSHPKIRAYQKTFVNFTDQKSYALSLASHEWIYFLDADELVPESLRLEILNTINADHEVVAYWNYRDFMFRDKRLYFSGWQTDKVFRLFRKSRCRFLQDRIVHESLEINGKEGKLKSRLIHYSYKNYSDYKGKMLSYGRLRALEEFEKGRKWSVLQQLFRPTWKFINHYLIRLGILDGKKGIIICYLNALGVWERYCHLRRLESPVAEKISQG